MRLKQGLILFYKFFQRGFGGRKPHSCVWARRFIRVGVLYNGWSMDFMGEKLATLEIRSLVVVKHVVFRAFLHMLSSNPHFLLTQTFLPFISFKLL